jgi:hypothetical protein
MMASPAKQMETLGNNVRSMFADAGGAAMQSLTPLITQLNAAFQAGKFQPFFDALSVGLDQVVQGAIRMLDWITKVYTFFTENWSWLEPIISGVGAAVLALYAALKLVAIGQAIVNAVMNANPFVLIATLIIGLIVYFYRLWKTNDDFAAAMMRAWNAILGFFDKIPLFFMRVGYGIADAFSYAKIASLQILEDLANGAVDRINELIEKLGEIPGVSLKAVQHVEFVAGEAAKEEAARQARDATLADKEAALAAKAADREADVQKFLQDREDKRAAAEKKAKDEEDAAKAGNSPYNFDDWNKRADAARTPSADDTLKKVDKVGKVEKPIDISKDDLKIMRDVAEMKNIQNFVTLTPTVQLKTGPVTNETNLDSIVKKIGTMLTEEVASSAKGVYN